MCNVLPADVPFEEIELDEQAVFSDVVTEESGWPIVHGGLAGRFLNDVPDGSSDNSPGIFRGRWTNNPNVPGGPFFGFWVGVEIDDTPSDPN